VEVEHEADNAYAVASDAHVTSGITARRRVQNQRRASVLVVDLTPPSIQHLKTPTAVPSQTINGKNNGNGNNGNKKPSCR